MDDDGSRSLNYDEFSKAVTESGLKMSDPERRQLFVYFDRDRGGAINYNEFLAGIRVRCSVVLLQSD